MRYELAPIDPAAAQRLPSSRPDASGVGVNYADAVLKPLKKVLLPDGTRVVCKRRGLKISLKVGTRKGEGLLRRLEHGPDVVDILKAALAEAAADAGVGLEIADDALWLELPETS